MSLEVAAAEVPMTDTKHTPNFRRTISGASSGEVVVPLLRSALYDPSFKSFTVEVEGWSARPPDGWFWPSTHPMWPERLLYEYVMDPSRLIAEPFDPTGTLAVTAGSFFHSFTQIVLVRENVLVKQPVVCGCGHKHRERAEVYLVDEEAGERGHTDGVTFDGDGFEYKTMNPAKMYGIPKGGPEDPEVLAWFIEKCPGYYLQAHSYLRMSGRRRMIVVIMELTYPFTMREIHIRYDPRVGQDLREKYLRVRQAVADGRPPRCVCGPADKECPARGVCWS